MSGQAGTVRQYVACKFRSEDARTYTYEWNGEPLESGDIVKVPDNRSDGWKRVTVVSVSDQAPPFPCERILGLYNPDIEGPATGEVCRALFPDGAAEQ